VTFPVRAGKKEDTGDCVRGRRIPHVFSDSGRVLKYEDGRVDKGVLTSLLDEATATDITRRHTIQVTYRMDREGRIRSKSESLTMHELKGMYRKVFGKPYNQN